MSEKIVLELILTVWAAGACAFILVTALCVVTHQLDNRRLLILFMFLLCWSNAVFIAIALNHKIRLRAKKKSEKTEEE